jgi:L,D-transpeptidase YnhG
MLSTACRLLLFTAISANAVAGGISVNPSSALGGERIAESKLIEVYELVGAGQSRQALVLAEALVRQFPTFQLAQLVHGDLLAARARPVNSFGDVREGLGEAVKQNLQELRSEAQLRIAALKHRPVQGTVPAQFLKLSALNKHAIAIDVSRGRLYLFEHKAGYVRLVSDHYISVGKAGFGKAVEGDQRTPLGLYFITSSLNPKSLKDLYGSGALPINYPNAYDVRRGKTGSGIWLHGTPSTQFSSAPQATEGCIAVANPDLLRIIQTVEVQSTPVLIAQRLTWVHPQDLALESAGFDATLDRWTRAKSTGDMRSLLSHYAPDFAADGKRLKDYQQLLQQEVVRLAGRAVRLAEVSVLGWSDDAQVRVVTFAQTVTGNAGGSHGRSSTRRHSGSAHCCDQRAFFVTVIKGSATSRKRGLVSPNETEVSLFDLTGGAARVHSFHEAVAIEAVFCDVSGGCKALFLCVDSVELFPCNFRQDQALPERRKGADGTQRVLVMACGGQLSQSACAGRTVSRLVRRCATQKIKASARFGDRARSPRVAGAVKPDRFVAPGTRREPLPSLASWRYRWRRRPAVHIAQQGIATEIQRDIDIRELLLDLQYLAARGLECAAVVDYSRGVLSAKVSTAAISSQNGQNPKRDSHHAYAVIRCPPCTRATRTPLVWRGSESVTRPKRSITAVAPVFVARSIGLWNSSARIRLICRC